MVYGVSCNGCSCSTRNNFSENDAIIEWNSRHVETPKTNFDKWKAGLTAYNLLPDENNDNRCSSCPAYSDCGVGIAGDDDSEMDCRESFLKWANTGVANGNS